jgi:hypothetical protein
MGSNFSVFFSASKWRDLSLQPLAALGPLRGAVTYSDFQMENHWQPCHFRICFSPE